MNQQESDRASSVLPDPRLGSGAAPSAAPVDLAAAQREIAALRDALAAAQERERLLVHELQHRVRNMLAVIRSIYRRTREVGASHEEFAEHFQGRLDAVARHHSHMGDAETSGIELEDMLRDELLEAHCLDEPRCTIGGPPVALRGKSAELMGLALHELTTNSIKFGALAHDGTVAVTWSLGDDGDARLLRFRWIETGVPLLTSAPRPSGFGRQLIEQALPYQLGATTSFDFKPGGIECVILLPLPTRDAIPSGAPEATVATSPLLPSEAEQW